MSPEVGRDHFLLQIDVFIIISFLFNVLFILVYFKYLRKTIKVYVIIHTENILYYNTYLNFLSVRVYMIKLYFSMMQEEAAELEFFDDWRKRYMKWKKQRKLRMMDLFRSVDTDQSGRLTHEQFTSNIIKSSLYKHVSS